MTSKNAPQTIALNLRPKPEGEALNDMLIESGIHARHIPIFDIHAYTDVLQVSKVKSSEYQAVIFVSRNAVRYGLEQLQKQGCKAKRFFAVGPATGKLLEQMLKQSPYLDYFEGFELFYPQPNKANSESFLKLSELEQLTANQHVLIVRGLTGRELIKDTLKARGIPVDYLEVYQRHLAEGAKSQIPAFWQTYQESCNQSNNKSYKNCIDSVVVIISSGEALKNLIPLTPDFFYEKCRLLVSSKRLAQFAREQGFSCVECADGATNQQVVSALVKDI